MAKRVKRVVELLGQGALGLAVAGVVFTGLTGLVAGAAGGPIQLVEVRKVDFRFVPPKAEVPTPRPDKPEHTKSTPPPIDRSISDGPCLGDCARIEVGPVIAVTPPIGGRRRFDIDVTHSASGDPIPLVRIPPEYPPNGRGDGSVLVRFDISKIGSVVNARVIDSTPPGMFDKAALRAIERWRYRPAVVDGQAVERRGVQVRLRFELARA
jgi:protein TonB